MSARDGRGSGTGRRVASPAPAAVALIAALGLAVCEEPVDPFVEVDDHLLVVQVTSPIGHRLAVGRDVQLHAVTVDEEGTVWEDGADRYTWESSAPEIASVSQVGRVTGIAAGSATISAAVDTLVGTVDLLVLDADLDAIAALGEDPFVTALITLLSEELREKVVDRLTQCGLAVAQGNFDLIETCAADLRADADDPDGPTDMVLLAVLSLFVDYIERVVAS